MTNNRRLPKEVRRAVDAAISAGWRFDYTSKGHARLMPPPGTMLRGEPCGPIFFAGTSSDWRGDKNSFARLRAAGVKW